MSGPSVSLRLVLVLGLLAALGPLSIDLYVPAFPELQADLRLGGAAVQTTLAAMTGGMALGQAVVGLSSDRVGRRRPLLLAAMLHLAGSLGCAVSPSFGVLLVCRFLQGFGAAGSAVLVLAVIRDLTDGEGFTRLLTRVTLLTTTAPLVAPAAGALLLPVVGWRGLFGVLAVLGAVLLAATAVLLPETRRPGTEVGAARIRRVVADRGFLTATIAAAATYAGVYAYVAAAPLLLRGVLGLDAPMFAAVFTLNSLGLAAGVQLAGRLVRRRPLSPVLLAFAAVALVAAVALLPMQGLGLAGVLPCLFVFVAACGGCFLCAATRSLRDQQARAGAATSVYGFITFASAAVVSPLPGVLAVGGAASLAFVLTGTALVCVAAAAVTLSARHAPRPRRVARRSPA